MTMDQFIFQSFGAPVSVNDLGPLLRERVFFNVGNAPSISPGGSQKAAPGDTVTVPVTHTPQGPMVVLYASDTDSRLNRPFAGLLLDEAIEIVHAMQKVKGIVLQSSQEPALVIEKSASDEVKIR